MHVIYNVVLVAMSLSTFETNTSPRIIVTLNNIMIPNIAYWALGKFSNKNPMGVSATDTTTAP